MGTWCTAGVDRQFARRNRENEYFDACREKRKAEEKVEKLKAENERLRKLLSEDERNDRDDNSL